MKIIQLKLEVHVTYGKDKKITTFFKSVNESNVINKGFLDEKSINKKWSLIFLRKNVQRV